MQYCKINDSKMQTVYTTVQNHTEKVTRKEISFDLDEKIENSLNADGFFRLVQINDKPALDEDEEIIYQMSRVGKEIQKTYLKKKISEELPEDVLIPRKFSKLKLYGICAQLGYWSRLVDWMKNTTLDGICLKDAFDYAQEISEDHPLFSAYFKLACESCGISDEDGRLILEQSILD